MCPFYYACGGLLRDAAHMNEVTSEAGRSPTDQDGGRASLSTSGKQLTGNVQQPRASRATIEQHPEWSIRNILVPTDYSAGSTKALQRAVVIANQCDAAITILHVIDVNAQAGVGTAQDLMEDLWNNASRQMADLAFSLAGQVNAQTMLEEGIPWEVITEKSGEFDLMVLAKGHCARGWNLFSKHTASRVIENATCHVMVVHD